MEERCGEFDSRSNEDDYEFNHLFLPQEMVIELFMRLPVESLLRFKTVCKCWFDILNTSNFLDAHYEHYRNHPRLLVYHDLPLSDNSQICHGVSIFPDDTLAGDPPSHHHLNYLDMPEYIQEVIGPVKRLFLVCRGGYRPPDTYEAALLNPATRQCKPLLVPFSDGFLYSLGHSHLLGLGFDPLTSDFKVVSLGYVNNALVDSVVTGPISKGAVYSLANDSWKLIQLDTSVRKHRMHDIRSSDSIYVNGSCYWLLCYNDCYLLSFDVSNEVLREIRGPGPGHESTRDPRLFLHNNSIAVLFHHPSDFEVFLKYIDIMVMKEEGCWTKDVTVNLNNIQVMSPPLGFWNNNILFLETSKRELVLYDPNTHKIRDLGLPKSPNSNPNFFTFVYKESLVPVEGRGQTQDHNILREFFMHGGNYFLVR